MMTKEEFIKEWRKLERQDIVPFNIRHFNSLFTFFERNTEENHQTEKLPFSRDGSVEVLITGLGTVDPLPVAYLYRFINPKKIIILRTEQAQRCYEKLMSMQVIEPHKIVDVPVKRMDAVHIYEVIKQRLELQPPKSIVIDVTAGTSLMSVALAKMGLVLNATLTWIITDMEKGKLLPWTSRLDTIQDPLVVWGDYEIQNVQRLFQNHQYATCVQYLDDMLKRIPLYNETRFIMDIRKKYCEMFAVWNQLDLNAAEEKCVEILDIFKHVNHEHHFDINSLRQKHEVLSLLKNVPHGKGLTNLNNDDVARYLLAYLFHSAERRSKTEDYMSSVLYLYRTLEMIAQFRLIRQDLSPDDPDDYLVLDNYYSEIKWRERYKESCLKLKHPSCELPKGRISLILGFQILWAIDDDIMKDINLWHIKSRAETRNKMIMEHGFNIVDEQKYINFRSLVEMMLKKLFSLHNWNWKDTLQKVEFPKELP